MALTFDEQADHKRDGDLCTLKCSVTTTGGTVWTDNALVGNILQIGVGFSGGPSDVATFVISDDTNGTELKTVSLTATTKAQMPEQINNGTGALCRGVLKMAASSVIGNGPWDLTIYYEKF